ncbi:unnamed protein product [Cylicostephanus goldi]|uniref:Uncharacterized protein n=1 Tax=Cylicostephanus goldi TaxID=71465 RepID=A0A3P7LVK9_CYLGO|nr:unnamed protein product [Cylicostephanus goldi]
MYQSSVRVCVAVQERYYLPLPVRAIINEFPNRSSRTRHGQTCQIGPYSNVLSTHAQAPISMMRERDRRDPYKGRSAE